MNVVHPAQPEVLDFRGRCSPGPTSAAGAPEWAFYPTREAAEDNIIVERLRRELTARPGEPAEHGRAEPPDPARSVRGQGCCNREKFPPQREIRPTACRAGPWSYPPR